MKMAWVSTLFIILMACNGSSSEPVVSQQPTAPQPELLKRITFGSCNKSDLPQPLWAPISQNNPDLWVWLGDIVYGDIGPDPANVMYNHQKNIEGYRKLREQTRVIGVWDDHDYGLNNGGKEHKDKVASRDLLFDFLDEPANSPRRQHEGAYMNYTFGPEGQQVAVILLDIRWNRDEPGPDGDILGETQWQWLENILRNSKAQIHIIGGGIQFLPRDHQYEKWSEFPKAHKRLLDLFAITKAPGLVLISGDRHLGEITRESEGLPYPVYEVTSSGMTHSYDSFEGEPNTRRVGEVFQYLHFGMIEIDWEGKKLDLQLRDKDNKIVVNKGLTFAEITPSQP